MVPATLVWSLKWFRQVLVNAVIAEVHFWRKEPYRFPDFSGLDNHFQPTSRVDSVERRVFVVLPFRQRATSLERIYVTD